MAGIEGCAAMGGRYDHGDTGLTDVEMAQSVDHGNAVNIPGLPHEDPDLLELLQSHCLVGFIDKMQRAFAFWMVADNSLEYTDRSVFPAQQLPGDSLRINDFAGDLIQLARPADDERYGIHFAAADRRK